MDRLDPATLERLEALEDDLSTYRTDGEEEIPVYHRDLEILLATARQHANLVALAKDILPCLSRNEFGDLEDRCLACGADKGEECRPECSMVKLAALVKEQP